MAKKRKRKKQKGILYYLGKIILFLIKIPYYIVKGVIKIKRKAREEKERKEIQKKREEIKANFEEFKILKTDSGKYENWFKKISKSDSNIGIILGARGTGKTAFGIKLLENIYAKTKKKCFAMGFDPSELPSWINNVEKPEDIKNNSTVLIDEGGILFSSRSSMSKPNKMLSKLILIARHKNISILFISQNSSNLEVNILRQADFLALKPSSLLQKDFERKIVQKIYEENEKTFKKLKSNRGLTLIYSEEFKGFLNNPLPSFWKESLSKSFK